MPFQEKDVSVNAARKPSADKTFAARHEPGKEKEKDREEKEKEREKPKEAPALVKRPRIKKKKLACLEYWCKRTNAGFRAAFGAGAERKKRDERERERERGRERARVSE